RLFRWRTLQRRQGHADQLHRQRQLRGNRRRRVHRGRGRRVLHLRGGFFLITRDAFTNLNNCTVSGNSATGDGGGLPTSVIGPTTPTNPTVSATSAGRDGGGVFTDGFDFFGTLEGTTNLTNCTVSGNSAARNGGGLDNGPLGSTTVTGSNVKNNSAV